MAKRTENVRKSVREILDDLLAGHQEASYSGPESALKYLRRTFENQGSLPNAVKAVAYDFTADAQAQVGDWDGCVASVNQTLGYLADLEGAFPHEFRRMLTGLACFERGIQAHSELGDFHGALELCERAIALDLGDHYAAKRDSLEWAR
jgi:tetratricopeptide (TPR) repeat protein